MSSFQTNISSFLIFFFMSRKPDYTRFAKIKGSSRTSLREVILLTSVCSFCRAAPVAEDRTGTYPEHRRSQRHIGGTRSDHKSNLGGSCSCAFLKICTTFSDNPRSNTLSSGGAERRVCGSDWALCLQLQSVRTVVTNTEQFSWAGLQRHPS